VEPHAADVSEATSRLSTRYLLISKWILHSPRHTASAEAPQMCGSHIGQGADADAKHLRHRVGLDCLFGVKFRS
jgi:hypothetical protein